MKYIEIIYRPKLNLLGLHYGIRDSSGNCYDFQPDGLRKITENEFAQGHEIKIEKRVIETLEAYARLREIVNKKTKYCFINFNCENFARYLVEGNSSSYQVNFVATMLLIGGTFWVFSE